MLALDRSLSRIETVESDVLDLFESQPVPIVLTGSRPERRTAYVCAVKKQSDVQVHVVLAAEHGRNFCYTKPDSGVSGESASYRNALEEALEFTRSMGFTPERVNLDYSPAMRAVVVKNFKIFSFPGSAAKAGANTPDPSRQKSPAKVESHFAPPVPVAPVAPAVMAASVASAATASAGAFTLAATTAAASISMGNDRTDQEATAGVIIKFGNEMAALRAERDALSAKLQELSAAQLAVTASLKAAKTENAQLVAERDRLAEPAAAFETIAAELAAAREKIAECDEERDDARRMQEDLVAENAAALATTARAKEEAARAQEEAVHARTEMARANETAAKATEELAKLQEESSAAREEAAGAMKEVASIKKEAASAKEAATRANKEVTKAREEAARADQELAGARKEAADAHSEVAGAKENAARATERAAELEKEVARLKRETAKVAEKRDLAAKRADEATQGNHSAGTEMEGLLATVDTLRAEKDAALQRVAQLEQQVEGKAAEVDAVRGELTALLAEREHLRVLGKEQAARIEALQAEAAVAAAQTQEAQRAPSPECEAFLPESANSPVLEQLSSVAVEAAMDPMTEPSVQIEMERFAVESEPAIPFAETAADAVLESDFRAFEADTVIFPDFSDLCADVADNCVEEMTVPVVEATPRTSTEVEFTAITAAEIAVDMMTSPGFSSDPFAGFGSAEDNFFGGFSEASEADAIFELKKDQTKIPYSSLDDVVELYKSYNAAHVAPDGKAQERCEGYICCIRMADKVQVFAAIYGKESSKVGVYVPTPQPSDERGLAAAVAGAINFHEQVGLMMDPVDLTSLQQRSKAVAGCPVLEQCNA